MGSNLHYSADSSNVPSMATYSGCPPNIFCTKLLNFGLFANSLAEMIIFKNVFVIEQKQGNKPSKPVKLNLNKKLDPKQKTIQAFNIDA